VSHGAHAVQQAQGHLAQHLVAGKVAVGVVHELEVVNVNHQQQGHIARAGHTVKLAVHGLSKTAPVGQRGQDVVGRQLAQRVDDRLYVRPPSTFGCAWAAFRFGQ
jgi:hypothetical protein